MFGYFNGASSAKVNFNICVGTPPPAPANDQCTNASTITASINDSCANKVTGTTAGATTTAPNGCLTLGKDVWYTFTPATSGNYLAQVTELTDTAFNSTYVSIYSGACGTLTQVGTSCTATTTTVALTANTAYLINVRSSSSAVTDYVTFDLCIRQIVPPANYDCANAKVLIVGTDLTCTNGVSGTTIGATQSLAGCVGTADYDVWYKFQATGAEHSIIINTVIGPGLSADTVTQVFDSCGGTSLVCQDSPNSPINLAGLTIGNNYVFRIYSYNSTTTTRASFTVCVGTPPPPPSNDDCAGAKVLAVGQTIFDNSTSSLGTPEGIGCDLGNAGLWYLFMGTGDMVRVDSAAQFDHEMAIASGSCGNFTNVSCSDDQLSGDVESSSFVTVLGTRYYTYIAQYAANNTTTGQMYVTLTGADNKWDGSVWSAGAPPTTSQNAVIAGPYNTGMNGNIDASSIEINTTQTVTVSPNTFIKTAGDIVVSGTLDVLHEGSVVQGFDSAETFGSGTITVRKTTPVLNARDFMIMSSPMTEET